MAGKGKTGKGKAALQPRVAPSDVSPWDEMERWFDEFGRQGWLHPFGRRWPEFAGGWTPFTAKLPKTDILDRDQDIVVKAELPGVAREDVEVTLTDHSVTIKAHTKHEEKEAEGEYFRREMSYGEYQRTLELPDIVDEEKAKATFRNGVLELTIPKLEQTPKRTVRVE